MSDSFEPLAMSGSPAFKSMTPETLILEEVPTLWVYSGNSREALHHRVARGQTSSEGSARLVLLATDRDIGQKRARAMELLVQNTGPVKGLRWDEGIYFRERPIEGDIAFVFTGSAGAYPGMGRELTLAFPELIDRLERFGEVAKETAWVFSERADQDITTGEKLWGSSLLSQLHAIVTREILGIVPQASIGYCLGEINALFAFDVWGNVGDLRDGLVREGVYDRALSGDFQVARTAWIQRGLAPAAWETWRITAPEEVVQAALANETDAHLTIVNAPGDVIVAGHAEACERVVGRVGHEYANALGFNMTMHCPEMKTFGSTWRSLVHRPTTAMANVRFYTHATCSSYELSADTVADALLGQALHTVDFPKLIRRAWDDGVRVFIEHGPQGGCASSIRRTLMDREHLAVSLDLRGESSLLQLLRTAGELLAGGVSFDVDALNRRLEPLGNTRRSSARVHPMPVAPWLPPVIESVYPVHSLLAHRPETRDNPMQMLLKRFEAHAKLLSEVHQEFVTTVERTFNSYLAASGAAPQPPIATPAVMPVTVRTNRKRDEHLIERVPMTPIGPQFSRTQLVTLASGKISSIFGPLFEQQDDYAVQVRMPEPPLLLADRVTGIDAAPGVLGIGTIWTETDVSRDAWYLNAFYMPPGVMAESGQADLLLLSWMGIDFLNRGERKYRLLGCDVMYHGSPPRVGETLKFEITIDGHAAQGDVRLVFFHSDCRVDGKLRMTLRHGQAGFFSTEDLRAPAGVLWSPEDIEIAPSARVDPPRLEAPHSYTKDQVDAFSNGRPYACFGKGWELTEAQRQPPRIQSGRMRFFDEILEFDPWGGAWKRGYLRARFEVTPDRCMMKGHFKDDPCMPGTLMCEAGFQLMSFYLAALGYTLDRDGWRFEPVTGELFDLKCRGQVTPATKEIIYELFVEEVQAGETPTVFSDFLGTADGLRICYVRRVAIRLVPDGTRSMRVVSNGISS
ncbi:MAG: hypothetical protein WCP34_03690 [Pseudomonadota bacterium]